MYCSERDKKQKVTLTFNFDMEAVNKAGLTTDELLEDMRSYAKEFKIDETSYAVFEKIGIDALAILYGYVVRKEDAEPDFTNYLFSWIVDDDGEKEDCKLSILKYREEEKRNGKNRKY